MTDQNPWPWIAQYTPPRVLTDYSNVRVRQALAVAHNILSDRVTDERTEAAHPIVADVAILEQLRERIEPERPAGPPPMLHETPLFSELCRPLTSDPGHAVWRMLRANAVKRNGPTPSLTKMERVVTAERAGILPRTDRMFVADEHDPDL